MDDIKKLVAAEIQFYCHNTLGAKLPEMYFNKIEKAEIQTISGLQTQVKVYPKAGGGPRYFNVRISELL
jgi:hypothetical protein